MPVYYGCITDYRGRYSLGKTGFGFLNRIFPVRNFCEDNSIYFHIKKVKAKYPELANQLDNGAYSNVYLWYSIETSDRGAQVGELWLKASDLPKTSIKAIREQLEVYWVNVDRQLPSWTEKITLEVGGVELRDHLAQIRQLKLKQVKEAKCRQAEAEHEARQKAAAEAAKQAEEQRRREVELLEERRKQEEASRLAEQKQRQLEAQIRANQIRQFCQRREITYLTHFTQLENLRSILQNGLFGRDSMKGLFSDLVPLVNDQERLDRCPEALCLNISFPNYKTFYTFRNRNRQAEWVVLLLSPAILWELDCAFCRENAASNNVRHIPLDQRKSFCSLEDMFADNFPIRRRQLPVFYPTHPQAEVLVFETIPAKYTVRVHFERYPSLQRWKSENSRLKLPELVVSQEYFYPRQDWQDWQHGIDSYDLEY